MKTKLLLSALLTFAFFLLPCTAQVPLGFNYQAIARDGSGNVLANQPLPVKIAIQTTGGTLIYEELFASITSNQFGLISLVVGTGTQTGGSATSFSAIDWKAQTLFLKTTIQYPGLTWTVMGTSQIWAVPYSLAAKEVTGPLTKLGITGATDDMEEALFEVKNKTGQTVFAVYNEGIRAYVGNGDAKGVRGGFSVGGYDATKGSGTIYNLFTLNTDSARLYFDSKPNLKGARGGFSVGGYDMTKDGPSFQNYLDVTPATTKIFTADTVKGFAVGNVSTGTAENYLKLTPSNYFVGHQAGINLTTGHGNAVMGYQAGASLTTGNANVLLGYQSGHNNTVGSYNTYIGYQAGYANINGVFNVNVGYQAGSNSPNTSYNTLLGWKAGYNLIAVTDLLHEGSQNLMLGYQAGYNTTTGFQSVVLGTIAGQNWQSGNSNVFVGYSAGAGSSGPSTQTGDIYIGYGAGNHAITGDDNVYIGFKAGGENRYTARNVMIGSNVNYTPGARTDNINDNVYIGYYVASPNSLGINNVMIGSGSGSGNNGSSNVFIGYQAGSAEAGSNKLYIDNSNTSSPLIYGDFTNGSEVVAFNGKVGINTMSPSCYLNTSSSIGTAISNSSEIANFTVTAGNVDNLRFYAYRKAAGTDWRDVAYRIQHRVDDQDMAYIEFNASNSGRDMALGTNNLERIRIDFNGNVGIGTTAPGYKLQVGNAGDGSQARANAWNLLSDIRLKTNFAEIIDPVGIISGLRGFYFNWNVGTDKSRQLGLSAQDVEKVLPEIVSQGSDGYLSVEYSKLTPVLIEAIKEQQQQIESQKQENQQLKSELQTVKERLDRIEVMMAGK